MIDPAILDAMLAAGASAEVIVAAVKADAAGEDARRMAQRAGNARRQRRYRDRLSADETGDLFEVSPPPADAGNALRDATGAAPDVTDATPPSLDKSPQTPKINPYPVPSGGNPAREAATGRFPCPAGCDPQDWRDLLANRRAKRLAMTAAAYRKLIRDLAEQADDAWPPGRVLAHAAEKGWAQIFDPRSDQRRDDHPRGAARHGNRSPARCSASSPDGGKLRNPLVRAAMRSEACGAGGGGSGF